MTQTASGLRNVDPATLKSWLDEGRALVIDVREAGEHEDERIEGAELMPMSRFDPASIPPAGDRTVVLHCRSGKRSATAAARLLAAGWDEVSHLDGGILAWKRAGLPVARSTAGPISVQRQVQITAGTLVLLGVVLGAWLSPWFLVISGFIGAGLIFTGATGSCAMAMVLSMMPWNRRACDA